MQYRNKRQAGNGIKLGRAYAFGFLIAVVAWLAVHGGGRAEQEEATDSR